MNAIRECADEERGEVLALINAAAQAYRGVIPTDRWRDPYMQASELDAEIAAGVRFFVYVASAELIGAMGVQAKGEVDLIRHAYVRPDRQRQGVGAALLARIRGLTERRLLVGTWAAAHWAIAFYRRHGFELVPAERKNALLKTYWAIPPRQVETSVVLASPPLGPGATEATS